MVINNGRCSTAFELALVFREDVHSQANCERVTLLLSLSNLDTPKLHPFNALMMLCVVTRHKQHSAVSERFQSLSTFYIDGSL